MIVLDFSTAEELVFSDPKVRAILPEFQPLFDSWILAVRAPALRPTGRRAILDFLGAVEDGHLEAISGLLGQEVRLQRLDHHIVKGFRAPVGDLCEHLLRGDWYANFAVSRDRHDATLTFWR